MESKQRPVVVTIISTMGAIIVALITSGYFTRTSAEKREDALEAKIKSLEAELKSRSETDTALAKLPGAAGTAETATTETATTARPPSVDPVETARRLAKTKNTELLTPSNSVKAVIAENATREYIFVGKINDPLLFSCSSSENHLWADVDILDSQGAIVLSGKSCDNLSQRFSFTPPKSDAYILKLKGMRSYGSFVIQVQPLTQAAAQ
jgi:hypothetical protein